MLIPAFALAIVAILMLVEQRVSLANQRWLRAHGAIEPSHDVFGTMRWAYPGAFVAMGIEGMLAGAPPAAWSVAGVFVFVAAKALKTWAIVSLGRRWTFRVLVLPDAPLVAGGPYAYVRHPNYVGVVGELAGFVLIVGALITGPVATILFAMLIRARIRVEEGALRHPPCA